MIIKLVMRNYNCTFSTQHLHLPGSILFSFLVYNVRLIPSHSTLLFSMKNELIIKYTSDLVCTNYWRMYVMGCGQDGIYICITIKRHTAEVIHIFFY